MLALTLNLPWPLAIYIVMSALTFVLYFLDKSRATRGAWRIGEKWLHLCELAGGWPGAFAAQRFFHHKSRKRDYLVVYWLIVLMHVAFWVWYLGWLRL